jgi:hypothetical protein
MDCHISVSIDSVDADNYALIRKNAQLDRVLENLRYFRDYTRRRGTLLTMAFCPMPQNWHELPQVVDFCNAWEMPLMFTTVESPPECSLSPLPSEATPLQRQNRASYQDQIAQVSAWRQAAVQREQAGLRHPAATFEEYIAQIEVLLRIDDRHDASAAKAIAAEIQAKLQFVRDTAATQGQGDAATAKIIATAPALVIRSVPGLRKEDLLELFKSFVMPLE